MSNKSQQKWLDAGSVGISEKFYRVTWPHEVKSLKFGDVVKVGYDTEARKHLLIRNDFTLHQIKDDYGQYVHLEEFAG